MKVLAVFLLLLGIFLFLGGLAGVIIVKTTREPYICTIVESEQIKAGKALKNYERERGGFEEYRYRKIAEQSQQLAGECAKGCAEKKEKLKYWRTVSSIVSGFGFLLTIAGIFKLPKRKVELR